VEDVHLTEQEAKAQDLDPSSGVSAPPSGTNPAAPRCQPGEAGRRGREGPCQSGGPQPEPCLALHAPTAGMGGATVTGLWDTVLNAQLVGSGGERPGNTSLSLNKEQPLGMCQASTPAAWGTTRLAQAELGGEQGLPWRPPRLGSGEGLTQH